MTKHIFKVLRYLLTAFSALLILSANTFAESQKEKVVRVGFFESNGMLNGARRDAEKSGYCYDYLMHISSYTGWKYEFVYGSFSDLYAKLRDGKIDILPYTNKNSNRTDEVLFSEIPMAEEEYYIVVREETEGGIEILDGATIATTQGYDSNSLLLDFLKDNNLNTRIIYLPSILGTWNALREGVVDASIWTSNSYSSDEWRSLCSFGKKPTYICTSKNRPDLMEQLNEAIGRINSESPSFFDNLYEKYFSDNPVRSLLTPIESEWIEAHPVLHVGGFTNDAPYIFNYDNENAFATGLTADVVNGILRQLKLNTRADFKCYNTLAEMEAALASGELDVIIPYYPDYYLAQQHNLIISNIVRVSNMELVFKVGTTYNEALTKVATPSTKLGIYYVKDNFPGSEILGSESIQDAVDKVLSGEATGAIAQNVVLHNIKSQYENLTSIVLPDGCGTCFATIPENYPLIRILNHGLMYFTSSEISSIAAKYTLEPTVTTRAYLAAHKDTFIHVIIVVMMLLLAISLYLARLKKKADEASKAKTTFLFSMSHDIRTPMNAILGFTDLAIKNVDDGERTKDCLQKIKSSGGHLLELINDILEMSRIESGKMELKSEPLDIREAISKAEHMSQALAIPKSITFNVNIGELSNPFVYADGLHLDEVFINIISNAMKYSHEGGTVTYEIDQISKVENGKANYRFRITDNGIGMSEEFQAHVFETFARENSATVSKQEGVGLGLSIVKRITDLAGGTIDIQSELGKGTTVTVEFPFKVMSEDAIKVFLEFHSPSYNANYDVDLTGKKVLLVEDNQLNREITEVILSEAKLQVETAEDGDIAVNMVKQKGVSYYDFILMDVQMPRMNGYDATRAIRKLPDGDAIPIIAVSANAFEEDRRKSLEAGMDDHVAKPIDIDTLLTAMKRLY